MNKKELLKKAKKEINKDLKIRGLYIIPQKKLHDSGYKQMYVIGHTEYKEELEDYEFYLLGTYSDVINLYGESLNFMNNGNNDIKTINLDINKYGIIHIWSDYDIFKIRYANISSVWLDKCGE